MTNEVKNVPELRFPEFEGEWEEKRLKELGEFKKSYSFSRALEGEGGYRHVHYGDIHSKLPSIIKNYKILPQIKETKTLDTTKCKDIIFADASEDYKDLGKAVLLEFNTDDNIIAGLHTHLFRPYENTISKFLIYFTKTENYYRFINQKGTGISVLGISKTNLGNIQIPTPKNQEQEKIGSFFSKLDRQIELEEQKLEKLKEQKKGYMQKIFSQKFRFKDENGNNYPEWEETDLGNLLVEINQKSTLNDQYLLLSSTKSGLVNQSAYFKKQIGSKDNTGYKILRLNQMVISPQNLWLGNINFNDQFEIGIVSPSYRIYEFNSKVTFQFLKYLLKTSRYIYEYGQASEQGASVVRRNLNLDLFYEIKVNLPKLVEQEKIGNFFKKIDKSIEKQFNKVELLKERKKGFLQKMFV